MQFDKTRIAIRERDLLDLFDLSLQIIRVHAWPLFVTSALGIVPFALLNYWLLSDLPLVEAEDYWAYAYRMTLLVIFETPLAAVPTTLLLGQAMFLDRFDYGRIARQAVQSLPQLFAHQALLRGLIMPQPLVWGRLDRDLVPLLSLLMFLWFLPYTLWPYLNELILLERNPLFTRSGSLSTWRRSRVLHSRYGGELFGRMLSCAFFGLTVVAGVWLASWYLRGFFAHEYVFDRTMYTVHLPLALWLAAAFFNIVRFLSYLDLRIRREGWEVELVLRAEAERLARQYV